MTTPAFSIPPPTLEPKLLDVATITLRISRVPSAFITDGVGGYVVYLARTRSGFAGAFGTGRDFESFATVLQPTSTSVFVDKTLTSPPTGVTLYFRVAAVDSIASPTMQSNWSNVVTYQQLGDRRTPVPAFPSDLIPGVGILKGLVTQFEDATPDAGPTWHDVRSAMVQAEELIENDLITAGGEFQLYDLLRSPPAAFRGWFENLAAALLIDRMSLPIDEAEKRRKVFADRAAGWRDEMFDDSGLIIPGGAALGRARSSIVRS